MGSRSRRRTVHDGMGSALGLGPWGQRVGPIGRGTVPRGGEARFLRYYPRSGRRCPCPALRERSEEALRGVKPWTSIAPLGALAPDSKTLRVFSSSRRSGSRTLRTVARCGVARDLIVAGRQNWRNAGHGRRSGAARREPGRENARSCALCGVATGRRVGGRDRLLGKDALDLGLRIARMGSDRGFLHTDSHCRKRSCL